MDNKEIVSLIYVELSQFPFLRKRNYEKGEIITNYISNRNYVYFLLSGSANLIRNTRHGQEELLEKYEQYDFFGDMFHNITLNNEMSVISKSKCSVFSFDFEQLKDNPDFYHVNQLLFELTTNKLRTMNLHTEVLSGKTTRDKLLTYFNIKTRNRINKIFELDMSYKELAAYLNVDRAAMMRKINMLIQDRMIKKNKRVIELLIY